MIDRFVPSLFPILYGRRFLGQITAERIHEFTSVFKNLVVAFCAFFTTLSMLLQIMTKRCKVSHMSSSFTHSTQTHILNSEKCWSVADFACKERQETNSSLSFWPVFLFKRLLQESTNWKPVPDEMFCLKCATMFSLVEFCPLKSKYLYVVRNGSFKCQVFDS